MFAGLILSGLLAAAPQLPAPAVPSAPSPPQKPDPAFSSLFEAPKPEAGEPASRTRPRTKVVCGMTLLLVRPDADPEMPRPAPKDGLTYTMRRYPPPACGKETGKR
jgi:hypothetical protein